VASATTTTTTSTTTSTSTQQTTQVPTTTLPAPAVPPTPPSAPPNTPPPTVQRRPTTSSPPFQPDTTTQTIAAGTAARKLPAAVIGFKPAGAPGSTTVRVFEGSDVAVVSELQSGIMTCSGGFWTLRWRSMNPSVSVRGSAVNDGLLTGDSTTSLVEGAAGGAGFISGFECETPAFAFVSSSDPSNLVDVAVEWQFWSPSV